MTMKKTLLGAAVALGLLASACGSDEAVPITAAAASDAPASDGAAAPAADATPSGVAATIQSSDLGEVLAGSNGLTLYGFTNDVDAASTCYGTCADAWPPVLVDVDFSVAPGLDVGIFATTERNDGQLQLVAGKWPLYFFAGDAVPGDLAGQGSGDVWFAVSTDGSLITDAESNETAAASNEPAGAIVAVASSEQGDILVNADGLSLYGFTEDVDGIPTCEGACADAWPPVLVDGPALPDGLDPNVFSVVEGANGTFQLKAGVWPLYLFAGDAAPGDINGQGSGDVWFLATPDGGLIRDGDTEAASTDSDY